ncbi:hypothetical protein OEZ85_004850 [Tetradesmus obliquus]|uniref:Uncharacterized protein n=1 Tax=Tetradesmus obliquus TaxID=3088 RepID=A0ABY8UG40_TETOB|nr:hypothetical protein OEZ85_004850 [Tetradesmus obliquus]
MAANREHGVFGTKLDDLSYTRSSNGTWPYAFLRYKNTERTFNPQPYLDEKLTACGLHDEQERQQFIARCVTDMRLVPHTKEGRNGCPGGTCTAQPFRYKFWLQRADGSQEAGWRGVGGEHLLPPLQQLVAEWRAARQHAAAAAAAGAGQIHPGEAGGADEAAAALRAVMQTQNWTNEPNLVSLASHVAQMAAARDAREAQGSSAEAAKARAAAEEAITERERISAVKELLGGVLSGVQRLQAGGAAVAGGPGLLAGGNMQALPAGMSGGCQVAEEAD